MARVMKWALLLLLASSICAFVLRKKQLSVLPTKPISENHQNSVGTLESLHRMILDAAQFGKDDDNIDASEPLKTVNFLLFDVQHLDDSADEFKLLNVLSKEANSLLDDGGNPKKGRRLLTEDSLLHQSSSPTIGKDGRVYACIGSNAYAFNLDGTLEWTADLNDTCQVLVSPAISNDGEVYVAANHKVYLISYSQNLNLLSVGVLFNSTGLDGSLLGSKTITGLALMDNGTSVLINAGVAGLYAVSEDGSPLWSTSGDFDSKDTTFSPGTFCSKQDTICYFLFSPAIDYCTRSIYIVHTNGWLYAIDGWKPYVKWRYDIKSSGKTSVAGVTAGNNGRVYVATITGRLYALDTDTGKLLWQATVGPLTNRTCFPKLDDKGQVILGSLDGFLYVISPNGQSVRRYLGDWAEKSIIHSSPFIDCAKREIFVAQIDVNVKTTTTTAVTYLGVKGVTLFVLDSYSGYISLSEYLPGESIANEEGILDPSLFLSVFASNHSKGGICKSFGAYAEGQKCILLSNGALEGVPAYIGTNIQPLYIALPLTFFMAGIMILIWYLLRKRYEYYYGQPAQPEIFDRYILPDFQDLCHKRAFFEDRVSKLERSLKNEPESEHLQIELCKAVEHLYTNEWFLSHFSFYCRSNSDVEPLLQESALSLSNMESHVLDTCTNLCQRDSVDPFANSAIPNEYALLEAKKNGYSQTSFKASMKKMDSLYPLNTSLERSSANPLFGASQYLGGSRISDSQGTFHDASDLENAYSPCWNSTEMSVDEQHTPEPDGNGLPDMVLGGPESMEISENCWSYYDAASTASKQPPSMNLDDHNFDTNTYQDIGSCRLEVLPQSLMVDGIEQTGFQPCFQPLSIEDSQESLDTIELSPKAWNGRNSVQGNEAFVPNEEDKSLSVNLTWVPNNASETLQGDEALMAEGTPLLNIKLYELEQGAADRLQKTHPVDSEGMLGKQVEPSLPVPASMDTMSPSDNAAEQSAPDSALLMVDTSFPSPTSLYLPSISEDPEAEELEAKLQEEEDKKLQQMEKEAKLEEEKILECMDERAPRQSSAMGGYERQPYVSYTQAYDVDTEQAAFTIRERASTLGEQVSTLGERLSAHEEITEHLKEEGNDKTDDAEEEDNLLKGEVKGETQEPFVGEEHNLERPSLSGFNTENQDITENSLVEAANEVSSQDKMALLDEADGCLDNDAKLLESTSVSPDVSTNTSISSRSESSKESSPRSPATTSVSEHAESFNSRWSSTTADVSDSDDSINDIDNSEAEGPTIGISTSLDPSSVRNVSQPGSITARDFPLNRLPQQGLRASTSGRESNAAMESSGACNSYSNSETHDRRRTSQQYSIPRLSISNERTFDSQSSGLRNSDSNSEILNWRRRSQQSSISRLPISNERSFDSQRRVEFEDRAFRLSPRASTHMSRMSAGRGSLLDWDTGEIGNEGFEREPS